MSADRPLASCLMPTTASRRRFAVAALRYFRRQDYPHRELLVLVTPEEQAIFDDHIDEPQVRLVVTAPGAGTGLKRNAGCEAARGDVIVQWDDDDWYGRTRLSAQLAPLVADAADVTGVADPAFFDLPAWRFWAAAPSWRRTLFSDGVFPGTLAFHRRAWDAFGPYPDLPCGQSGSLLRAAATGGARIVPVSGDGVFLYVRHGSNTWRLQPGRSGGPRAWSPLPEPHLPAEDRCFYRSLREHLTGRPDSVAGKPDGIRDSMPGPVAYPPPCAGRPGRAEYDPDAPEGLPATTAT